MRLVSIQGDTSLFEEDNMTRQEDVGKYLAVEGGQVGNQRRSCGKIIRVTLLDYKTDRGMIITHQQFKKGPYNIFNDEQDLKDFLGGKNNGKSKSM